MNSAFLYKEPRLRACTPKCLRYACLREAPPAEVFVQRAAAPAKAGHAGVTVLRVRPNLIYKPALHSVL